MKKQSSVKFAIDILFSALPPLVAKFSSYILLPLISKVMGSVLYGVWQQFSVTTTFFLRLTSLNVGTGLKKYLTKNIEHEIIEREFSSVISFVIILALLVSSVFFLFREDFSLWIFGQSGFEQLAILIVFFLPIETLLNEYSNFLRGQRLNKLLSIYSSLRHLTKILVLSCSILFFKKIEFIIGFFILTEFSWLMIFLYKVHIKLGYRFVNPHFKLVKKYLKFGIPLLVGSLGIWLTALSDRYLILYFLDIRSVGIYSGAYVLGSVALLLVRPITQVLLPDFSLLVSKGDFSTIEKRLNTLLKLYATGALFFILINYLFADVLLIAMSNKDFLEGIIVMKVVTIGIAAYGFMQLLNSVLSALNKKSNFGFFWLIIGGINIISNIVLIPKLQLLGAAISTLISYTLGSIIFVVLTKKQIAIKFNLVMFFKLLAVLICILLIGTGIKQYDIANYFFVVVMCSLFFGGFYLIALYKLNFFTSNEKLFFLKLKSKIF
ncbi:MAG: oligosaccharide flippase family protein [Saprospiraceae bacterium]